jgi:2-polyprenyl-6-methoxyphenol hydroxylase-like FAD-dependent oxidoreductase
MHTRSSTLFDMSRQKVLICGAGVAGSILAFWLARADYDVVVVERSRVDQKLGQGIEIEQPATRVVERMGVLEELRQRKTVEAGFKLHDESSRCWAKLDIGRASPTGALELMRGDLTEVLYKAANESANVEYRYQTVIDGVEPKGDKVIVQLKSRSTESTTTEVFDFVIGADGARSRTRELTLGSLDCFKPVGAFVAYFSIPKHDADVPYSKLCHFSNRRVIWLRPVSKDSEVTSVYLIHIGSTPALREAGNDRQKQREAMAEAFADCGWEAPRVMKQMLHADNFYFDELMQVKLPTWSKDRVALLGDAAWAPTPFTGQGNQLAIIGAWVLAQEMTRDRTPSAFQKYENRLRQYVVESQKIPLGGRAPRLCCPKTAAGIFLFRMVLLMISWIATLLAKFGIGNAENAEGDHPFDLEMDK